MTPTGPEITRLAREGRPSLYSTRFSLRSVGYVLDELVVAGTARSFEPGGEDRPFRTRLVVARPADPARADGTVVVEWLNVSGGLEVPPMWMNAHTGIIRSGSVHVAVSAQALGIEGGLDLHGQRTSAGLRAGDPERYGDLHHPGDPWSFDVFASAGDALRRHGEAVLGGIRPRLVLATGHSQSAHRLVAFINHVDADRPVFDGFLVLGRGVGEAPLGEEDLRTIGRGRPVPLPAAGRVPVLCVQSETDVVMLGSARSRTPDGPRLRTWEIAGAAHADTYQLIAGPIDDGCRPVPELVDAVEPPNELFGLPCDPPVNSGLQQHYVTVAALSALRGWAAGGPPPSAAEPLVLDGEGLATDETGTARAGVRTPFSDAPTAALSGLGQNGPAFARLFGTTRILAASELRRRYRDERGYRAAAEDSCAAAVSAGFVLEADAAELVGVAVEQWRRRSI